MKELTGRGRRSRGNSVKTKDGNTAIDIKDMLERWNKYQRELFDDNWEDLLQTILPFKGFESLARGIEGLRRMTTKRSSGRDEIMIEAVHKIEYSVNFVKK